MINICTTSHTSRSGRLAKITETQNTKDTEEGKTAAEMGGPHGEGQE